MSETPAVIQFRDAEAAYHASLGVRAVERTYEVPGMDIVARYLDVGSGPAVLMVHGGGGLGSAWTPLVPYLPGHRLIIPDRPGFGLTGIVDYRGCDLRAHAVAFLSSVLDAASVSSASIVANSMGGLWSLWLAQANPHRVQRLALLGTPARLLETSAPAGMRLLGVPRVNRLMMRLEPPSAKQVRTLFKRMGHDPSRVCTPEMTELVIRAEQLPNFVPAWLSLLENVLPYARINARVGFDKSDLAQLRQPVLYVWGKNDPFGSLDVAHRAHQATPGSRLNVVGTGHLPWLDEPAACGRIISEFLSTDEPATTNAH